MGGAAAWSATRKAGALIAGLQVTESVCPYCIPACPFGVVARDHDDGLCDE